MINPDKKWQVKTDLLKMIKTVCFSGDKIVL